MPERCGSNGRGKKVSLTDPFQIPNHTGAMIFSYMAITLVALLIFLLFSLNYTERTILENSESYTIQLVEQVNGDIDSYISYMENIMDIVTNNPELSDYLFDRMEHIMMRERIQEQFVTLMDARSDICNIAVFAKNGPDPHQQRNGHTQSVCGSRQHALVSGYDGGGRKSGDLRFTCPECHRGKISVGDHAEQRTDQSGNA